MDVRCDKCQARYRIDDARVGPAGLTMRCGKCGNTFKVTKEGAAAQPAAAPSSAPPPAAAAAKKPAAAVTAKPAPDANVGATMMFAAPTAGAAPSKTVTPKPAPEDSGSTMVFGSAPVLPAKAVVPPPKAAPKPAAGTEQVGSTMVFGSAPVPARPPPPAAPKPPAPGTAKPPAPAMARPAQPPRTTAPAPKPKEASNEPAANDDAIPTRASQATFKPAAPAVLAPVQMGEEEEAETGEEEAAAPGAINGAAEDEPQQAKPGERVGDDEVDDVALTGEAPAGVLDKRPPKSLIIGVSAVVAALVLALAGLLVVKKMGPKPPPEAALQALEQGRALADKDSLALFPQALETTKAALLAAPKSPFAEAHAAQAEIEIAWADALNDSATQSTELAAKAGEGGDDKKRTELEAKATESQTQAKAHLKAALEAVNGGVKAAPKAPELSVALADYYRASRSNSQLNKELKRAGALKADEAQLAMVQGLALLADEDGAEKALPKLKQALAASAQSARLQYKVAQALLALKNEGEGRSALAATLKLSPTHERARTALELLGAPAGGAEPAKPASADGK